MKHIKFIMMLILAISILSFSANATVESNPFSPVGGSWITASPFNFTFSCSGNSTVNYNGSIYIDASGSFVKNHTFFNIAHAATVNVTFPSVLSDNNSGYQWRLECINNDTGERTNSSIVSFKVDGTAPTQPNISRPVNGSVLGETTPLVNWTPSTETNFLRYRVQFSANDSTFADAGITKQMIITSRTQTSVNFSEALPGNVRYFLRVLAEDEAGNTAYQWTNVSIVTSVPSITVVRQENNTFTNDNSTLFNITATHQLLDRCELVINASGAYKPNITNDSRINGTMLFQIGKADDETLLEGQFVWSFRCNNTGGNVTNTANFTITIDKTAPAAFGCINPVNNSKSIDHTPELVYSSAFDSNFGNYTIVVDNNTDYSSPEIQLNNSNMSMNWSVLNFRAYDSIDRQWFINISAVDKAGNRRVSSNCSQWAYRTDITNHILKSGWNLVGIMQSGTVNASDLGSGLGVSWTTISKYNSSKQFQNYNNGSASNAGMTFVKGDVVFINVNADTYFENQTWDTDVNYLHEQKINLTNTSVGWNVIGVQNQTGWTLGQIELGILKSNIPASGGESGARYYYELFNVTLPRNDSFTSVVYFNNTALTNKKFVGHPRNLTFNNNTLVDFGEVVWIKINNSINGSKSLWVINASLIN